MSIRSLSSALALCAVVAVGTVPRPFAAAQSLAALPAAPTVIAFGNEGGNMRPLKVTIDADGTVSASYAAAGLPTTLHLTPDALGGLLTLARAEGFWTMPTRSVGHGLPDIGGRYITITADGKTRSVHVRYVQKTAFNQLYAVLAITVGLPA